MSEPEDPLLDDNIVDPFDEEDADEQFENSEVGGPLEKVKVAEKKKKAEWLAPYQYKKGQSGNPAGRPVGTISLKERAKRMLASMTDEEAEEYLHGIDKRTIWEMAEGRPEAKTDITSKGEQLNQTPPAVIEALAQQLNALYEGTNIGGDGDSASSMGTEASD